MTDTEKSLAFTMGAMVKLRAHTRAEYDIMSPNGFGLILSSKCLFGLEIYSIDVLTQGGKIITVYCDDVIPLW